MPISESLYILFNNINSQDFDMLNAHVESGLYSEQFITDRTIMETRVRNNPIPFFQGIEESSRIIKCSLAFTETFDENKLREVKRWLHTEFYAPLIFSSNPDHIYYALCSNASDLMHAGNGIGYIDVEFVCDSNFVYSPIYISDLYDLSTNPVSTTIIFENLGDLDCQPILYLTKINDGDISIKNLSDGGAELKFSAVLDTDGITVIKQSLLNNEELIIDNEHQDISTSIPDTYRYDNHNGIFLNMKFGVNNLQIIGTCKLQFKHQFKLL